MEISEQIELIYEKIGAIRIAIEDLEQLDAVKLSKYRDEVWGIYSVLGDVQNTAYSVFDGLEDK